MPGPRFATARALFEACPQARGDTSAVPTDDAVPDFVRALSASSTPEDAVTVCAYALGVREAVWWGAQCLRALDGIGPGEEDVLLLAAETWVREPTDDRRTAALHAAAGVDRREPTAWLALAAAWAGPLALDGEPQTAGLDAAMTPKAVRTAVLAALALVAVKDRQSRLLGCVGLGLRMMGDRDAHDANG